MDIRHMRTFLTVAEELHFRRASELLNLSQPALTLQIQQLEEEVGARLMERTSRSVRLTPAGEALVTKAREILRDIDAAIVHTRRVSNGIEGTLSLVYVGTAASLVLARSIRILQSQMPQIDLQLDDCRPAEQIKRLVEGKADLGFMHGHFENTQLASKVVQRDRLIAAVPMSFSACTDIDVCELAQHPLIVPRSMAYRVTGMYEMVLSMFAKAGVAPSRVLHGNIMNALMMVAHGVGVTIVPEFLQQTRMHNVRFIPIRTEDTFLELSAVWNPGNPSAILRRFIADL